MLQISFYSIPNFTQNLFIMLNFIAYLNFLAITIIPYKLQVSYITCVAICSYAVTSIIIIIYLQLVLLFV